MNSAVVINSCYSFVVKVERDPFFNFPIETWNDCSVKLLIRFTIGMDKDDRTNETAGDNQIEEENSDTNKDIKKRMDKYEAKIKAGGEAPEGDATRSDE